MHLTDLRRYARAIGVKSPTTCNKDVLIKKIVEIDDMFKDDSLLRLGSLTDEQKKSYLDKCDSVLSAVPEFVKLSVLADKKVDSLCQVITPTHCQKIYDYLRRIANYLKFIDAKQNLSVQVHPSF